jgi:hypothetical protein
MGIARIIAIATVFACGVLASTVPRHGRMSYFAPLEEDTCPFPGAQQCDGTGFGTCTPSGEWVYQDCAPGTICVQGWGAAKWHIWCVVG